MFRSIWAARDVLRAMVSREIRARYQGSFGGLLWSIVIPVVMLAVYTFVFSVVFKSRWGNQSSSHADFGIVLFVGLVIHGFLSEVLVRAPGLIVGNLNFVKKVVFPLEVLPVVSVFTAVFQLLVNLFVLLVGIVLVRGAVPSTALMLPVILVPLILGSLGIAWVLAATSVYLRDIGQIMPVFTSLLLFVSPVFFPLSAVPAVMQKWILLNPLTLVIEESRSVLIWGELPGVASLLVIWAGALALSFFGYWWFQKTRKGFADVL